MQPFSTSLTPFAVPDAYSDLLDTVEPVKEPNPFLTWMTGNLPTADRREMPFGWHVHKGVNPPLDALLTHLKYQSHLIEHLNEKGEGELVEYWALNHRWNGEQNAFVLVPCSLFVLARGVKAAREMNKNPHDRDGVAYGWEVVRDKDKHVVTKPDGSPKKACKVKFRCYIQELLPAPDEEWKSANGFLDWFQVSATGYLCDDLLEVLDSLYRARRAYHQLTGEKAPYWGLSNPTQPSQKPRIVKSKEGQPKSIITIQSLIPSREKDIALDFLSQHRISPALQREIIEGDVLMVAWDWSIQESGYLEGIKPRPTGNQASGEDAVSVPGTVVREESQAAPAQATLPAIADTDPSLDASQVMVLTMLCGNDAGRIQGICQEYSVRELTQLRQSQFRTILVRVSQG